jgi:hypothetical protein
MMTRTLILLVALAAACASDDSAFAPDATTTLSDAAMDAGGQHDLTRPDTKPTTPAGQCPQGACNLISNKGCSDRRACRYLSFPGGALEPVCEMAGKRPRGMGCFQQTDCGPALMCSPISFTCVGYCCGGAGCAQGELCLDLWKGVGYCEPDRRCNLFTGAGCAKEEACLVANDAGATICIERQAKKKEGVECGAAECDVGMQCAKGPNEKQSTCKRFCPVGDQSSCDVGKRCESENLSQRPDIGMCNDVSDPCSGSPNQGACTNTADCGVYEADPLATVSAAVRCAQESNPKDCVVKKTGLSPACATCFTNLPTSSRKVFLTCAGF